MSQAEELVEVVCITKNANGLSDRFGGANVELKRD